MGKKRIKSAEDRLRLWMERIARGFVLAVLCLHPLAMGPETYYGFTEFKMGFYIALVCALGLCGLMTGLFFLTQGWVPTLRPKRLVRALRPYDWALLAYFAVMFFSACFSEFPSVAWGGATARNEGFWMQTSYIAFFFFISRFYKPRTKDFLAYSIVASVIAIYAMFQYYGLDFLGLNIPEYDGVYEQVLFFATVSNRNMASVYFGIALCVSAIHFAQLKTKLRFAFLLPALIAFYILVLGDTQSGYVGLLGAFLLGFALLMKDRLCIARILTLLGGFALLALLHRYLRNVVISPNLTPAEALGSLPLFLGAGLLLAGAAVRFIRLPLRPPARLTLKTWRRGWLVLVAAMMIIGVLRLPAIAETAGSPLILKEASSLLKTGLTDEMGSSRGYIWRRAFTFFLEKPILGHGPDNFGVTFHARYGEESVARYGVTHDKAHNEYLQTLVDTGILGLLCLLAFYFLLLFARRQLDDPAVIACAFTLIFFLIQAFFNFAQPFTTPIVWVFWGAFAALSNPPSNAHVLKAQAKERPHPSHRGNA